MMGMAAVLLYNVVELTKKYLAYPISVKFSVEHQQQLTFPTIAICNMSPVKKSSLEAAQLVKRRKKRSVGRLFLFRLSPWLHVLYRQTVYTRPCLHLHAVGGQFKPTQR